ncbi:MAG: hypothetical protein QNJ33_06795 [Crocosphaera sp.]|nr:hypothetical protein [Crocosphaera sp.]
MILKYIKKVLNPNFLQQIDQEFLLNHPRLWTLKIHYLCYYVGIVNVLLLIGFCLYRFKIYHTTTLREVKVVFFTINSIVIIGWVILQFYYNVAYNPEKQFGEVDFNKGWLFDIFGYLLCFIILSSPGIIFCLMVQYKIINYPISQDKIISDFMILKLLEMDKMGLETFNKKSCSEFTEEESQIECTPYFEKQEDENIFDYNYRFLNQPQFNIRAKEIQNKIIDLQNFNKNYFEIDSFLQQNTDINCSQDFEDCKLILFLTSESFDWIIRNICNYNESQKIIKLMYNSLKREKIIKSLSLQKYDYFFDLISKYTGKRMKSKEKANDFLEETRQTYMNYRLMITQFNFKYIIKDIFLSVFTLLAIFLFATLMIINTKSLFMEISRLIVLLVSIYLSSVLTTTTLVNIPDCYDKNNSLNESCTIFLLIFYSVIYLIFILLNIFFKKCKNHNSKNYDLKIILSFINLLIIHITIQLLSLTVTICLEINSSMIYQTEPSICDITIPAIESIRKQTSVDIQRNTMYKNYDLLYLTYGLILAIIYISTTPYIKHFLIKNSSLPKEK